MQTIEVIEQTHAIKTMITVLKEEPIAKSDLYKLLQKNVEVVKNKIRDLVAAELMVEEIVKKDGTQVRMLTLTPKGRRVAEKLRDIDDILSET